MSHQMLSVVVLAMTIVLSAFGLWASASLIRAGWRRWLVNLTDQLTWKRAGFNHARKIGWDTRQRFQEHHGGRTMGADVDWLLYHLARHGTNALLRPVSWLHYHLLYLPNQRRIRAYRMDNDRAYRAYQVGNEASLNHGWRG